VAIKPHGLQASSHHVGKKASGYCNVLREFPNSFCELIFMDQLLTTKSTNFMLHAPICCLPKLVLHPNKANFAFHYFIQSSLLITLCSFFCKIICLSLVLCSLL